MVVLWLSERKRWRPKAASISARVYWPRTRRGTGSAQGSSSSWINSCCPPSRLLLQRASRWLPITTKGRSCTPAEKTSATDPRPVVRRAGVYADTLVVMPLEGRHLAKICEICRPCPVRFPPGSVGPAVFHAQLRINSKKVQELVHVNLIDTGQHFGRPAALGDQPAEEGLG